MRVQRAIQSEAQLSGVPYFEYQHYPEPGFAENLTPVGTNGSTYLAMGNIFGKYIE